MNYLMDATSYNTEQPQNEPPLTGMQILLVEDEFDVAQLLMFILEEAGAEITWATQATEALAQVEQLRPDVLMCNIKLPDHDGDWLIQRIREAELGKPDHLPAIAVTSYTREFRAEKVLKAGFERFLPKNFDSEQLISSILELV